MSKSPAFQFYANDWLSSTKITLMTPAQEGAYIRLLCYAWNDPDCSIPDDDQQLAVLSRLGEGWFNNGSRLVRECFEPHPEKQGRLVNRRLLEERQKQEQWREKSRQGGIQSGQTRRAKPVKRITKPALKGGSTTLEPPNEGWLNQTRTLQSSSSSSSSDIKEEKKDMSNLRSTAVRSPVSEVFEHWKTVLNHPRAILDSKRQRLIRSRLDEGFSVDDLKAAINGCKASPWHQGLNDRGQTYDDLALICRDASKVEQFIGYVNGHGRAGNGRADLAPFSPAARETILAGERILAEMREKGEL